MSGVFQAAGRCPVNEDSKKTTARPPQAVATFLLINAKE